jgi:dolichyl-diphosphooligosaccharide--protein glycosyltransferase
MEITHSFSVEQTTPERKAPKYKLLILIIIPLIVGAYILNQSTSTRNLEKFFEIQVHNALAEKILYETLEKYPQLSKTEKEIIAQAKLKEQLALPETKEYVQQLAEKQQDYFKDKNGQLYLLEPDAYYYLRHAENILKRGHTGEILREGKAIDTLRRAPLGEAAPWTLLPAIEAYWLKLWRIISPNITMLKAAFYLPIALGLLSITLIFFLTLKIFKDDETAFFSALLFSVHPYFFRQNMAGFTDTTTLIMPLSLAFFLSILWITEGNKLQRSIAAIGTIAALTALKYTWNGWFFVIAVAGPFCIALTIFHSLHLKRNKIPALTGICLAGTGIAYWLYKNGYVEKTITKLQFTPSGLQETVKELTRPTFSELIKAIGDPLFGLLLLTAAAWMLIRIVNRKASWQEIFLFIWLVALSIPATRILRFVLFAVPPATILTAWLMKKMKYGLTQLISSLNVASLRTASLLTLILLPAIVGATMIDVTKVPLSPMNSAISETSEWFKENTSTDALINTWWDYGYVWQYAAKRPTVLDATPSTAAHWMARALLTTNETYALNILRMLDCSNKKAHTAYAEKFGNTSMLEKVLQQKKEDAEQTLGESRELINLTHCAPSEAYFIVDQNMIDIAPTIEAIALWDQEIGIGIPDNKISTVNTCTARNETVLECSGYLVDLENLNATRNGKKPHSLELFQEGNYTSKTYSEGELSLVVYKDESDFYRSLLMTPGLARSMLIRLFAQDDFDQFEIAYNAYKPKRTMTWKINWNTNQEDPLPSEHEKNISSPSQDQLSQLLNATIYSEASS